MNIPEAKVAVDKEWDTLKMFASLARIQSKKPNKKSRKHKKKTTQFILQRLWTCATLKISELDKKFKKYKGRPVLRGEAAKDGSGSYAVFTEQGSSATHMTAEPMY